jgi:Domain of unknown function (DUF4258)
MKIIFPLYVLKRMIERNISVENVRAVLENGDIIEEYKGDVPPRYLVFDWIDDRPLHVVAEDDLLTEETTAVTVYEPSRKNWKSGFRERKKL